MFDTNCGKKRDKSDQLAIKIEDGQKGRISEGKY